jgi:hypothetical protein
MAAAALPAAQTLAGDFQKAYGKSPILAKILAVIAQRRSDQPPIAAECGASRNGHKTWLQWVSEPFGS